MTSCEPSSPVLYTNASLAHTSNWRSWPEARYLPHVFPSYLCKSLVKKSYKASVQAYFAPIPDECSLNLELSATQVSYVAKELFDIHIDVQENRRYLTIDPGVKMDIDGTMTFRGASPIAIAKLFGATVNISLQSSSKFVEEVNLGEDRTSCISMAVERDATRPSIIKLLVKKYTSFKLLFINIKYVILYKNILIFIKIKISNYIFKFLFKLIIILKIK